MIKKYRNIKNKIIMDYLTPDKMPEYKYALGYAIDNGYKLMTVRDFYYYSIDKVKTIRYPIRVQDKKMK